MIVAGAGPLSATEADLWTEFANRCLDSYLTESLPSVDGLIEVSPARESQRSFRSRDESLLMILESNPAQGLHACKLYGFHETEEPAGEANFTEWRTNVLAAGDFETDDIGRLFSAKGMKPSLLVDARTGESVTVYEVAVLE